MMITTGVRNSGETEVRAVLDEYTAAHEARDADRILALFTEDAVRFSLAPPLQQAAGTMVGDAEGLRSWFATFDGPVRIEYHGLSVLQDGEVAVTHALSRMTAIPTGASEPFSFWFRSTFGLRKADDRWRIVHVHDSTPFYMDGSFRAALDLRP